jgi:ribosomal-protein-alanine N-acetyltransferase
LNNVAGNSKLKVTIRPMTAADLDRVVALEKMIFPDPWPKSSFVEILSERGWGALVAETDGTVIGYACYLIVAPEAHLANIAVDLAYRRKAVAKRLLERILRIVKENECAYLLLEVRAGNVEAKAFYERYGFTLLYRRKNYYRHPVEDALVMVRFLDREKETS